MSYLRLKGINWAQGIFEEFEEDLVSDLLLGPTTILKKSEREGEGKMKAKQKKEKKKREGEGEERFLTLSS